jgi:Tfp pilus assembly protein PilX
MTTSLRFTPRLARRRRGVALLLVMVGLVVCTLLVAGFLSTQGTSIGIARNERDAQRSRNCAQSGIDLCYWLIQNRSDWRTAMTPGTWLNNAAVGDGTVTVTAADGDNSGSFSDDPTASVILTAVGISNNRSFTLTCRVSPTGGGTVFRGGSFALGQLIMHNSALIDSFDSSVAPYNILFPGSNALFGTNSTQSGALTMDGLASFRGSFVGGPGALVGNLINALLGLLIPTSVSSASQTYIPGRVIPPNTTGLPQYAAKIVSGSPTTNVPISPGEYPSINVASGNLVLGTGTFRVTGNLTSISNINVSPGANAVLEVDGVLSSTGKIQVPANSSLALYFGNTATLSGTLSSTSGAANFKIFGLSTAPTLTLKGTTTAATAVIFAPQTSFYMTDSAKLYGAVIAKDFTADKNAAFHFDENTKSIRIDNITGGSAPTGTADYILNRVGAS